MPLCIGVVTILALQSCQGDTTDSAMRSQDNTEFKYFEEVPPAQSNVTFNNTLTESLSMNFMTEQGMLIGAGVGVLDVNNDGNQDIYFAANMGNDELYLNKENFKFENITKPAGIKSNTWSTGVAIVDINGDGYDDIYVCKSLHSNPQQRANQFFINNRDNTFTESAAQLGLDDAGYSVMANFFDYDRDGDLDVYVANQPPNSRAYRAQYKGINDFQYTDRMYRNDGGRFTDVTESSGIKNYSYSLSATSIDFNQDGWQDIYIACDYEEPDFFYKNNGNGTFTNVADSALKHMSNFSMGADVADINNDGHLDFYVADMVAEDNFRQKTNMSGMNPERFYKLASVGFHYQYMYNVLQMNNSDNTFSDLAQLAGVSNTDWSWSPLFMDIDLDGYKDLVVTNGIYREMRNKDFEKWRIKWFEDYNKATQTGTAHTMNPMDVINKAPSQKIANYAFKNEGNLSFTKKTEDWGLSKKNWSQGSAYADFDNDGDLDMVMNNTNMTAELYRNKAIEGTKSNYLNIELSGSPLNAQGIGTRVELKTKSTKQVTELTPYRGYMSSSQNIAHFGLGDDEMVTELKVIWSDNKSLTLKNLKPNQTIRIKKSEAKESYTRGTKKKEIFEEYAVSKVFHSENKFDDYESEVLLPYSTSSLGPITATGDINGDGQMDLYLGGSVGNTGSLIILDENLKIKTTRSLKLNMLSEDGGATLFDFDLDGDLDLYVTSGGNEYEENSANYADRLYINDGKGQFQRSDKHPRLKGSNGAVLAFDYDKDGDKDLLVAGRLVPKKYGQAASSFLLENRNSQLVDVTDAVAPFLKDIGMVTSLGTGDINADGIDELFITGEWLGIQAYQIGKTFEEVTKDLGLDNTNGWWNTLQLADVDNDGDIDLVAGNLGLNIKYKASQEEPFKLYADDFDANGTNDVYLGYYENGKCYPVRGRQCSSEQMPFVSESFKSYETFGNATITEVLEDRISESTVLNEAYTFASAVFINETGSFKKVDLPNEAQKAPVYGIAIDDFDRDGNRDIFLAGNYYNREVETTRSDAGKGCMLTFEKGGIIKVTTTELTGINAERDVRSIQKISNDNSGLLFIANNNSAAQFYKY